MLFLRGLGTFFFKNDLWKLFEEDTALFLVCLVQQPGQGRFVCPWDQEMFLHQVWTYKHKEYFLFFHPTSMMCSFNFQMGNISLLALKITF